MAEFAGWFRNLKNWQMFGGLVLTLFAAGVSIGAGAVNLMGLPAKVSANTEMVTEAVFKLDQHIRQDSVATAKIYCVVRLLAEDNGPVNPLACDGGD